MHDVIQDAPKAQQPWRSDARAAALVGFAHLTSHFFQMLLPPIYPWLMKDFGIGFTEAGFLATVFFVTSSSGQALAGFAVDRIGAFRVLLAGIGFLVAAGVVLGFSHSYAGVLVTAALAGSGNAMFHPADFTILNHRVSSARLGHAFAMHSLSGNLGWVAGASFMGGVAAFAGWHVAGFGAAAIALGSLLFMFTQRNSLAGTLSALHTGPAPGGHSAGHAGQFAFLRSGTVWLCFGFFFLSVGAGGILQNFAPAILANVYSVSLALGTMSLSAYLLGGGVGTVLGGFFAGREPRSELIIASALCLAAAVSLVLATGAVPTQALLAAVFVLGCGSGTAGPSRDLLVRHAATSRFGATSFGRVYGFVYSGLDGGLAVAPLLVGRLLDHGWFRSGLICIAALQISAVFVALRVSRRTPAST
ncbi:MAG TPA: MFS transporter [Burkholderiaceae bacterium]|nr:MFS transporter [Burkholderiaceae bacterium]